MAARTGRWLATRLRPVARAAFADLHNRDVDRFLHPEDSLFKCDRHVIAQVGTALRSMIGAPPAASAKKSLKDIGETTEIRKAFKAGGSAIGRSMSEPVVGRSLLGVTQDFVG